MPNYVHFMAPELLLFNEFRHKENMVKITEAADMYSLGCVIFNMFTGVPPYYSENISELRAKIKY